MTSADLVNQCFKTCSSIQLTMIKSSLLNSALLRIRILALAFNSSYASSVMIKTRNPLTLCGIRWQFWIPYTLCGTHLQLQNSEELAIFACCGIRDSTNVPTNFTLHSIVRGIHGTYIVEHIQRLFSGI